MAKKRRKDDRDFTADFGNDHFDSLDADENNSEQQTSELHPNSSLNCDEQNVDNLCRDFVRNICRRGRKCKYKHPTLTQNTWTNKADTKVNNNINNNQFEVNFCHDYQNNGCSRPQCRFIHCNRPEQEFYYATGILLSNVPCNSIQQNIPVPFCKDFLNGSCTRVKCKYLHLNNDEIEQQSNFHELKTNQSADYPIFNHRPTIEQNTIQTNSNFFSNTNGNFFPATQQVNVIPSQNNPLGNGLPLTNAQFTVSLPLGSVSYSTSQQQLIAQPSLTNVQYIHDPILSSVAHEVGSINTDVLTQLSASNQHNIVSQIHPQQQVVYSGIIHNSSVSLPQHHTLQPQFTLISSDSANHSQMISAPLVVGSNNATGHIINPVAVAHPSQNQQFTISQQPPVGVSIFSVATPCSILSASPTTADVMQTFQHQQLRSYEHNDSGCLIQKNVTANGTVEFSVNDSNQQLNSALTPIYIHHSLPSAVPVTQYRVTALESTTAPGIVIHSPLDRNNLTLLHATSKNSNNKTDEEYNTENHNLTTSVLSAKTVPDNYHFIMKENEKLKSKLMELQKQTNDLQTANELLLDQNARLRNSRSCCNNPVGNNISSESNSFQSNRDLETGATINKVYQQRYHPSIQCSPISSNNFTKLLSSQQNDVISNTMSEMATITLTVPLGKSLDHQSSTDSLSSPTPGTFDDNQCPSNKSKITPPMDTRYSSSHSSFGESCLQNVLSTSVCSNRISPTLVTSALRSFQKSVMPTLNALVASSNAVVTTSDCTTTENRIANNVTNHCIKKSEFCVGSDKSSEVEVPMRSSSCPVTCSYTAVPERTIRCHESTCNNTCCYLKESDLRHTPQMCFQ